MTPWKQEIRRLEAALAERTRERDSESHRLRVLIEDRDKMRAELARLKAELDEVVNAAGEALGTDPSLRTIACVAVLAHHTESLRSELARLREKAEAIDAIEALVHMTRASEGAVTIGANHDDNAVVSGWSCELTDHDGYVVVVDHLPSPAAAILSALAAARAKETK